MAGGGLDVDQSHAGLLWPRTFGKDNCSAYPVGGRRAAALTKGSPRN